MERLNKWSSVHVYIQWYKFRPYSVYYNIHIFRKSLQAASPKVLITRPPASFCLLGCDQKLRYDLEWPQLATGLVFSVSHHHEIYRPQAYRFMLSLTKLINNMQTQQLVFIVLCEPVLVIMGIAPMYRSILINYCLTISLPPTWGK